MMNLQNSLAEALINSFEIVFRDIIIFLPKFIFAFIMLAVLVWVANIVSKLIGDLLRLMKIDYLLSRLGITQAFHEVGFQVSIAYATQTLIKWILVLVAVLSAFSLLGLTEIEIFLESILVFVLPEILTLAIMIFITFVIANKIRDLVSHSSYVAKHHSPFLAKLIWFLVILFGVVATLKQMEILQFITDATSGIIQALGLGVALALGLAFGLGCKEEARCLVRSWVGKDCYDLDCGCNTFGCANCSDMSVNDDHDHDCDCDDCNVK